MNNIFKNTTFMAIVACWLWSTAFAAVKIGLEYHTPFQFAGIRFFISGLLIFIFFKNPLEYFNQIRSNLKFILLVSILNTFVHYAFFYTGINMVPGALGAMIIGSSPLFIAIVAHFSFHNDKMTKLKTLSILIGVAGIIIITTGRSAQQFSGDMEILGIVFLLINNIISGYSNVLVSKSPDNLSPLVLSSASLIIGGSMLMLVSLPLEGIPSNGFPLQYYIALCWLSFLSATAFSIWFSLLKRSGVKVSLLNIWKFIIPVSGAILSWIIIEDEKPDYVSVIGMIIIAISLFTLNYANRRYAKNLK